VGEPALVQDNRPARHQSARDATLAPWARRSPSSAGASGGAYLWTADTKHPSFLVGGTAFAGCQRWRGCHVPGERPEETFAWRDRIHIDLRVAASCLRRMRGRRCCGRLRWVRSYSA